MYFYLFINLIIYLLIYLFIMFCISSRTIGDICKGRASNAVIYRADPGLLIPSHTNTQQHQHQHHGKDFQITPNSTDIVPDGGHSQKKQNYPLELKSQNIPNSLNSLITEKSVLNSTNSSSAPFSQIMSSKKFPPKNVPSLHGK